LAEKMKDEYKTKRQLIQELRALRRRVSRLESSKTRRKGERRRTEENEKWFKDYLDKLGYLAYEADAEGNVIYANKMSEKITGLPLTEIIGEPFFPLFSKESQIIARDGHQRTLKGESPEYELTLTNGRIVRCKNEPLRNRNGKVVGLFGIARDVTEYKRLGEALRKNESRYRAVVEDQTELICRFLPDGKLTFANEAYCKYFGNDREGLVGHEFIPFIPEEDRNSVKAHFASFGLVKPVATHEHRTIGPDGAVRWHQWTSRAIFDKQGQIVEFQSVGRDITKQKQAEEGLRSALDKLERRIEVRTADLLVAHKKLMQKIEEQKRAEQKLVESEERFRELADLLPQTVFEIDEEGNFLFANRHAFESTGYTQEDLDRGLNSIQLFVPRDRDRMRENVRRRLTGERFGGTEYKVLRKDGSTFPAVVYSARIIREGRVKGLRGVVIDLTDLKQTENALRESEKRLRLLYSRLLEAQEEERKRLARDLHDGFGQCLAVLKLNSRIVKECCEGIDPKVDEIADKSISLLSDMIEELRQITTGLRPGMLDHLGLIPTLESYMATLFEGLDVEVHFSADGFDNRIDPDVEVNLYRIVQEALNNVVKHANAKNVWLTLKQNHSRLIVLIEDDGRGFDPARVEENSSGQGLLGLRERVGFFDGHFSLDSAPGRGCKIRIEMEPQVSKEAGDVPIESAHRG
jgi:PAS domain S-box-containing protein